LQAVHSSAHLRACESRPQRDFISIYRAHFTFVKQALQRYGVNEMDAGDQAQLVFLVVLRKLDDFDGRSRLETWLFGICRRVARNYRRSASRRPERPITPNALLRYSDLSQRGPEASLHLKQAERLLRRLPQSHSEVFVLFALEGMRRAEIAHSLGISTGTVGYRLRSARQLLTRAAEAPKRC
jgi:RNA polymerase sigma-70 factor, ECF subfamily